MLIFLIPACSLLSDGLYPFRVPAILISLLLFRRRRARRKALWVKPLCQEGVLPAPARTSGSHQARGFPSVHRFGMIHTDRSVVALLPLFVLLADHRAGGRA
jgi:hypothetical protein